MIDIKDLQIGNKVKYKDDIVEIAATHLTGYVGILGAFKSMIVSVKCEEIEPIEVTEEMLEKIGFEVKYSCVVDGLYSNQIDKFCIEIEERFTDRDEQILFCKIYDEDCYEIGKFKFQYLHELQNGVRLITKQDLDTLEVML